MRVELGPDGLEGQPGRRQGLPRTALGSRVGVVGEQVVGRLSSTLRRIVTSIRRSGVALVHGIVRVGFVDSRAVLHSVPIFEVEANRDANLTGGLIDVLHLAIAVVVVVAVRVQILVE